MSETVDYCNQSIPLSNLQPLSLLDYVNEDVRYLTESPSANTWLEDMVLNPRLVFNEARHQPSPPGQKFEKISEHKRAQNLIDMQYHCYTRTTFGENVWKTIQCFCYVLYINLLTRV